MTSLLSRFCALLLLITVCLDTWAAEIGTLVPRATSTNAYAPGGVDVAITDGGTGKSTAPAAFDALSQAAEVSVASAATTAIGAAASARVLITGTSAITSFGTAPAGTMRWGRFSDAATLTYNATSMILPGAADITTAAGDQFMAISMGSGNWRLVYDKADGTPLVGGGGGGLSGLTAGRVPYATSGTAIANGPMSVSGTNVSVFGDLTVNSIVATNGTIKISGTNVSIVGTLSVDSIITTNGITIGLGGTNLSVSGNILANGGVFTNMLILNGVSVLTTASISDVAFASSWNTVTATAASKNAVYDWGHIFDTDDDGKVNVLDIVAGIPQTDSSGVVSLSPIAVSGATNITVTGNVSVNALTATNGVTIPGTGAATLFFGDSDDSHGFRITAFDTMTTNINFIPPPAVVGGLLKSVVVGTNMYLTNAVAGTDYIVPSTHIGTHASPSTTDPLSPTWSGSMITIYYGATGEINLPPAADYADRGALIYNTGAFTITIDPNGSEVIVRDGTVQTGGVTFTLSSGAGNFVALISDGVRWITLGVKGVLTVGS